LRFLQASFLILAMLVIAISFSMLPFEETALPSATLAIAQLQQDAVWEVNDTIELTVGWVEWTEQWYNPQPHQLIEDDFWFEYHTREYLINPSDLFLELYETFNWTAVNEVFLDFNDWNDFKEQIADDPAWWLNWSWNLNCLRYGISTNSTFIDSELDEDVAFVSVWCHITQVAEYLIGDELGVGEGFDFQSISLGKLETYEYISDYTLTDRSIHVHFTAPANILQEQGESYIATIHIDAFEREEPSKWTRKIIIVMPSITQVTETEATPKSIGSSINSEIDRNMAIFTIQQGEFLPASFTVKSMPPQKTLLEFLVNPEVVAVLIATIILLPSSIQGIRMIRRDRTYNRMLRLIVKLYHEYKPNPDALEKEMENLTESIFASFIENKITDEQLEKLLHRRDDFLARLNQ